MDGHDRRFERPWIPPEEQHGQHQHPRHPDEEPAFLSAPETGQRKPEGHSVIEVFPNVLELVAVAEDEQVQQGHGGEDAAGVQAESPATQLHPVRFRLSHCDGVSDGRGQGRSEGQREEQASEGGRPGPFSEIGDVHGRRAQGASVASARLCDCSLYLLGHFMSISPAMNWPSTTRP